jgi:hypothetical protein
MLEKLTDDQIDQLITEHWREIRGLLNELRRRRNATRAVD